MDKWRGKVAIVTGANSGIGAAIAASLVREGVVVVGLDLHEDNIKTLAGELSTGDAPGKLYSVKADLRKEEDILSAFGWVEKELGGPHLLVNNAGVFKMDYIVDGKTEDWRDMLDINLLAVAICSREYLNYLEKQNINIGHIINICSLAGHLVMPQRGMYAATKHAVRAFSMCLRKELAEKNSNVKVTVVNPGHVATPILISSPTLKLSKEAPLLEPADVAKVVLDALSASSVTQICEVIVNPIPSTIVAY